MRYIEHAARQCRAKAEAGDAFCRFHGGKAPTHEGKKQERISDYQDQIMELADLALDTVQAKLASPNHAVALRAALEVLDRAGIVTTRKTETTTTIHQKSEIDAKIDELLAEMSGEAGHPPAHSQPAPVTSTSSPPQPQHTDRLGMPEELGGGGHGLGLSGSGVSGDDNVDEVP
jgi:hypothetical protein